MPRLETTYSTLEWSADGALVTKRRLTRPDARRRFTNELRVNRLLRAEPPPICTPALVSHEARTRTLTFEAVDGRPLGPKYPSQLAPEAIEAMAAMATCLHTYAPRRRWFRRLYSARRIAQAHRAGLLADDEAASLGDMARRTHTTLRFGHGDLTARNVLHAGGQSALIDWEWAGLYPIGYDHAFLWFTLVDVEGGRDLVEQLVDVDRASFLLSALLIQLWHLQWWVPFQFRDRHLATRDELVARLTR